MSIILDLVIIAFIAIFVIIGYVKGLTGSLIKILSFVLSLVIAFVLFVPVSNMIINKTQIDENLEKAIKSKLITQQENNLTKTDENMPTAITDYLNEKINTAATEAKDGIVNSASRDVSITIIKAATWITLFIFARILLILLKFITGLITRLPVIKQFDKLGGIIYGLIEGLIITYALLAIISFVTPMTNGNLSEKINNSYVGSQMYNNNLLLKIIF